MDSQNFTLEVKLKCHSGEKVDTYLCTYFKKIHHKLTYLPHESNLSSEWSGGMPHCIETQLENVFQSKFSQNDWL